MDKKPAVDRSLFIPIALGLFSLVGICVILLFPRLGRPVSFPATSTETPFKYIYLGTEPRITTDIPLETSTDFVTESPAPAPTSIPLFTPTAFSVPTFLIPSNAARTPTLFIPLLPSYGTYDDTDSRLLYEGDWDPQSDVNGVYQNTLHISSTIGDSISFSFIGQKFRFLYQAGPSLGQVNINVDTLDFTLDQLNTATESGGWDSALLVKAVHTVTITHISGGSINIDSVIIPDLSTPTPTSTANP